MARSVTCTSIASANGKHYARFGKAELEFTSLAEVREYVRDVDVDEVLRKIMLAAWMARNPTGNNPGLLVGKKITLDLESNNVLVLANA